MAAARMTRKETPARSGEEILVPNERGACRAHVLSALSVGVPAARCCPAAESRRSGASDPPLRDHRRLSVLSCADEEKEAIMGGLVRDGALIGCRPQRQEGFPVDRADTPQTEGTGRDG